MASSLRMLGWVLWVDRFAGKHAAGRVIETVYEGSMLEVFASCCGGPNVPCLSKSTRNPKPESRQRGQQQPPRLSDIQLNNALFPRLYIVASQALVPAPEFATFMRRSWPLSVCLVWELHCNSVDVGFLPVILHTRGPQTTRSCALLFVVGCPD